MSSTVTVTLLKFGGFIDSKMRLFQVVQNLLRNMGICPSISSVHSINIRNSSFLLNMLLLFVTATGAFLFEESSIIQQAQGFAVSISEVTCMVNMVAFTWKRDEVFHLIERLEDFVEKSKNSRKIMQVFVTF